MTNISDITNLDSPDLYAPEEKPDPCTGLLEIENVLGLCIRHIDDVILDNDLSLRVQDGLHGLTYILGWAKEKMDPILDEVDSLQRAIKGEVA